MPNLNQQNSEEMKDMMFNEKRCYRPDEVAAKLGVSKVTIYRMINDIDDPLPAFKIKRNGQIRMYGKALNNYFYEHTIRPWE